MNIHENILFVVKGKLFIKRYFKFQNKKLKNFFIYNSNRPLLTFFFFFLEESNAYITQNICEGKKGVPRVSNALDLYICDNTNERTFALAL